MGVSPLVAYIDSRGGGHGAREETTEVLVVVDGNVDSRGGLAGRDGRCRAWERGWWRWGVEMLQFREDGRGWWRRDCLILC